MRRVPSNRSFGLLLTVICLAVSAFYYLHGQLSYVWAALGLLLLAVSLTIPRILAPAKRLWLKLAELLSRVVSPIALGLMYVFAMVPVGVLIRLSGKDLLSLRHDPSAHSYWINRSRSASPESLKDQF